MAKPSFVSGLSEPTNKVDADDDMQWKARNALEDIERAESHKRDRELMKHVKKAAREKVKNLKKIC